jgi:hypothetical protein
MSTGFTARLGARSRPSTGFSNPPRIGWNEGRLRVDNRHFTLQFATSPVLLLTSLYNKHIRSDCLIGGLSSRLFFLWVDQKRLEAKDFTVRDVQVENGKGVKRAIFSLFCPQSKVKGRLAILVDDSSEWSLSLSLTNQESQERELRVLFPYLENLCIGEGLADNYYFFPYQAGWTGNHPYHLACAYGSSTGSVQLISLFNPGLGGGVYAYLKDQTGRPKTLYLRKVDRSVDSLPTYEPLWPEYALEDRIWHSDPGVETAFYSWPYQWKPGQSIALPKTVMGLHGGDLKVALASYSRWAHTWFKPLQTPQWYKDNFVYVVSHDRNGLPGYETGFLKDGKVKGGKIVLSQLARTYDHYLQIAYWHKHSRTDFEGTEKDYPWYRHTVGDYTYEQEWGGLPALQQEIRRAQAIGPRIILYGGTPYLAWKYSEVFQKHPEWALMNKKGEQVRDYWGVIDPTPGIGEYRYIDMCPQVEPWQDWLAETNKSIIKDTGASGVYLDTMNLVCPCYDPQHQHEEYPAIAAEKLLRKIVSAVRSANPEATVDVETVDSDYLMQWIDGSWSQTFSSTLPSGRQDHFDLYSVSFLRFMFPEVKYAEHGSNFEDGARRAFFSGIGRLRSAADGIKDEQTGQAVTVQQQLDYSVATGQVMKENGDAFSSLTPECLVPTLRAGVYANRFPAKSKVLYTLYNKNDQAVEGEIMMAPPGTGYHGVELLYDREVSFDKASGIISLAIGPWEVVCVARLPEVLRLKRQKDFLVIEVRGRGASPGLKLLVDQDSGRERGREVEIRNKVARIDLRPYAGRRLIIKLFEGNYLADERIVGGTE